MGTMCDMNMRRPLGVWKPRPKKLPYRTKTDLPLPLPVNHHDGDQYYQHPSAKEDEEFLAYVLQAYTKLSPLLQGEREIEALGAGTVSQFQFVQSSSLPLCKLQLQLPC
jgi:hypothetical protein